MHSDELKSLLTNIEEFVFDDKKIVSCSWLSKTLGIHSNLSKQLLHTFFQKCPKKEDLSVTYLVIGLPKNKNSYQVSIVEGKDLEKLEMDLETITSKHIYSIQKCFELTDLNVLYAAQKEESVELIPKGISAIDFKYNERDGNLLARLKLNALPTSSSQPIISKKPDSQSINVSKSPTKSVKVDQSNPVTNSEKIKESTSNPEIKNHPMFKNNIASKKKAHEKVPANQKKNGGIGAFFSKTAKPCDEPSKKAPDVKIVETTKSISEVKEIISPKKENKATLNYNKETNNKCSTGSGKESITSSKKADLKPKVTSKKVDAKKNKRSSVKTKDKEDKKRKRLVVLSDSDSDSSEDEKEVEREPTPEPQPSLLPDEDVDDMISGTPEPSRKRKKKLVSKSFTSSDGYLMTEKVYVSCSEEEEEEEAQIKKFKESSPQDKICSINNDSVREKNTTLSSFKKEVVAKTKNSSPQKVKQASLMNFFKKK